jgi:hypothetical protein
MLENGWKWLLEEYWKWEIQTLADRVPRNMKIFLNFNGGGKFRKTKCLWNLLLFCCLWVVTIIGQWDDMYIGKF